MLALTFTWMMIAQSPWVDGPPAPSPSQPLPFPQAPREEGAREEALDVPPLAPEPVKPPLDDGVPTSALDPRLFTMRTRDELFARGALDLDSALVDVTGLWLRHEQAGASRMLLRGLDDRDAVVRMDGVPLFDLAGLVPPLEQLSNASTARFTLHHGARAMSSGAHGAAGVIDVDTLGTLRAQGESMGVHGSLGGGYGGADLEKGVFTHLDTGFERARVGVHATLLNREDLRLGRSDAFDPNASPGALLVRSNGNGGAVGARVDVVPFRSMHLFTTWHSARALAAPHPDLCQESDVLGRARDCTRTVERGLDAWIVGGDERFDVSGADVIVRARAHMQHALAVDERAGVGITVVERSIDEGVRAGASLTGELALPPVALGDVWAPRAIVGVEGYADRFESAFFSRSVRNRDAEPPGLGTRDDARAHLEDGGVDGFSSLSLQLLAEGARATLWGAGRVAYVDEARVAQAHPEGELGARVRIVDAWSAFAAVVHKSGDESMELGVGWRESWIEGDVVTWGALRRDVVVDARDDVTVVDVELRDTTAYGAEARGALRPGVEGLRALGTFALVTVDEGALFDATRVPAAGVVNPAATLTLDYAPTIALPTVPSPAVANGEASVGAGFFARTRALFPQQRIGPDETLDRAVCPEQPSDDQLEGGVVRTRPCTGATGTFMLDVGARLDLGGFRIDAVAENLLDQQGALRNEPIGFGGTSFRALLTLRL